MTPRLSLPITIVVGLSTLFGAAAKSRAAEIRTYGDLATFAAETGATNATGPLPDLGLVVSATVGSVTFGIAAGGDNMAIGAAGTAAAPDWSPLLPGNDIAMGYENLAVTLAAPAYSLGFDFDQPDVTMPSWGGTPVDSTYEISLYSGTTLVGQVRFASIPTDVATFLGVWSNEPFDNATIIDVTVSPFVDDDEFFGEFHSGTTPLPTVTACTDKVVFLATTGAQSATGPLPDVGLVASAKLGSVTLGLAPGGDNMAIGAANTPVAPDWCPLLPGNDIAMGYENLQLDFDEPVLSLGFDFVQPDVTMPSWGGTPVDSDFEVRLYLDATFVGSVLFTSIPTDQLTFLGVCSDTPFNRATIIDVTASPFVDDDEFFGEFFTGPGPTTWTNLGHSFKGVWGDPVLSGSGPLTAGSSGSLVLWNASPSSLALLDASLTETPVSAFCGTIVPWPPQLLLVLSTDASGELPIPWTSWSPSLSGISLYLQYMVQDPAIPCGVSISNALRGDAP